MSAATVMFVLKNILEKPASDGNNRICSMAFGPGLTVETALLTRIGATRSDAGTGAVADGASVGLAPDDADVPADLEPILTQAGA